MITILELQFEQAYDTTKMITEMIRIATINQCHVATFVAYSGRTFIDRRLVVSAETNPAIAWANLADTGLEKNCGRINFPKGWVDLHWSKQNQGCGG